ncbi:MAG: hypothetical protein ACRDN9_01325 [Streptosporangiaceae bacterium]
MYSVETDQDALDQVTALPTKALAPYAKLIALLEVAPWSGDAYNRQRPEANMRAHPFGEHDQGLAIYLVLEDQRRVIVLRVMWAG